MPLTRRGSVCSLHHVTLLSPFRGSALPGTVLLLGGKVSGGVEHAAAHRGDRGPGQERGALPALLPRRPGEAQLPQRSHLCVVGSLHALLGSVYRGVSFLSKVNGIEMSL